MGRPLLSIAALVAGLVLVGAAVGCAANDPVEPLPIYQGGAEVDASGPAPTPALGASSGSSGSSSSSSSSSGGGTMGSSGGGDAGSSGATDSGGASGGMPTKPAPGDILITEVMFNPSGPEPTSEWFEIRNVASGPRDLSGLTIASSSGHTHVIAAGTVAPVDAYLVFARDKAQATTTKLPAASIFYEYGAGLTDTSGVVLLNGSTGTLSISDGATTIVEAPYGGFSMSQDGSSVQLKALDASKMSSSASWCMSSAAWTTGADKGTPGAANDCP